uniref:Uncharacterized protein n=1 Tax=Timema poppense TaxID=170557 RepID=A0A7R9CHV4_TIMPO|nr:unnamed protein product [Timema poppensis]
MSLDRLVISVGIIIGKLQVVLDVRLAIVILLVPMLSSAICMMVNVIASQDSEVANVTSVKPIIGETQLWNVMLASAILKALILCNVIATMVVVYAQLELVGKNVMNAREDETEHVIHSASEIKQTGVTGAYSQAFESMEKKLREVKQLLENTTINSHDLENLESLVENLRSNFNHSSESLEAVENLLQNTTQRIYLANLALSELRNKSANLRDRAHTLKDDATKLQEANVEGALNLTQEAQKGSLKAQQIADGSEEQVAEAERYYKRTEARINRTANQFEEEREGNSRFLVTLSEKLKELELDIPNLNEKVCDKRGDPCDQLCGGAGCGSCGGLLSCEQGAVTKADTTVQLAEDAKQAIKEKEAQAEGLLRKISQAKQDTLTAHDVAKEAYDSAVLVRNRSENTIEESRDVTKRIQDFMETPKATPANIRDLAEEVMQKNIDLKPEEITELAEAINDRIASLTNIDTILTDTSDNLALANSLKTKADMTRKDAIQILETAQNVVDALNEAKEAQDKAEDAISKAKKDIETAKLDLTSISSETDEAQQKANETVTDVDLLKDRLKQLQTSVLINERAANEVAEAARKVKDEANSAEENANYLSNDYQQAADSLQRRTAASSESQKRARGLLERASQFSVGTTAKLKDLEECRKLKKKQSENERKAQVAEVEKAEFSLAANTSLEVDSVLFTSCGVFGSPVLLSPILGSRPERPRYSDLQII